MKIVSYVRWTEPGEKQRFENCVKSTKNDEELKSKLIEEFETNSLSAQVMLKNFQSDINKIRNGQ